MRLPSLSIAACAAVVALANCAFAQDLPPSPERIAFRYDDSHVIVVLDQTGGNVSDNPADELSPLPPPSTRNTGLDELGVSDDLMTRFADLFGRTATGQAWMVQGDGAHRFSATVEKLAFASADCATAIDGVAILAIAPDQQQAFREFPGNYFLAVASGAAGVPSGNVGLAPGEVKLSGAQSRQLKAALEAQLAAELRRIRTASKAANTEKAGGDEATTDRWTAADARLAKGEGKLTWRAQRLVVGPHGEERLYVRAVWSLGDYAAFVMSAWAEPRAMHLEGVQGRPATWVVNGAMKNGAPEDAMLRTILGVYEGDGGWARVLVGSAQGDGYEMEIVQLSPQGPKQTDIAYGFGC